MPSRRARACVLGILLIGCGSRTGLDIEIVPETGGVPEAGSDVTVPAGLAVLFGGQSEMGPLLGDTWTWDGSAWTKLDVAGPSARYGAAVAALGGKIVLFGGFAAESEILGDTWTWDGAAWTQLDVVGPSARYGAVMAALGGVLVLTGGYTSYLGGLKTDTWTWDGTAWTQRDLRGPSPPRGGSSMAALGDTLVFYGGEGLPNGYLADTWIYDGSAWTQQDLAGPPAREGAALGALLNELVLIGGYDDGSDLDGGTPFPDTWTWNGYTWIELMIPGPPASNRGGRAAPTIANVDGKLVLFGGGTFDGTRWDSHTWTFDGSTWTQLDVRGPLARASAAMATP
jgi:Kelch motif protein/galactose oxidase-like protein